MFIAFASTNGQTIDAHFASAPSFVMYKYAENRLERVNMCFPPIPEGSNDKVEDRISLLKDCAIVYCAQIGGPAAARLVQNGIHPLKVQEGTFITDELNRLNHLLSTNPPPWLKKKLGLAQ